MRKSTNRIYSNLSTLILLFFEGLFWVVKIGVVVPVVILNPDLDIILSTYAGWDTEKMLFSRSCSMAIFHLSQSSLFWACPFFEFTWMFLFTRTIRSCTVTVDALWVVCRVVTFGTITFGNVVKDVVIIGVLLFGIDTGSDGKLVIYVVGLIVGLVVRLIVGLVGGLTITFGLLWIFAPYKSIMVKICCWE